MTFRMGVWGLTFDSLLTAQLHHVPSTAYQPPLTPPGSCQMKLVLHLHHRGGHSRTVWAGQGGAVPRRAARAAQALRGVPTPCVAGGVHWMGPLRLRRGLQAISACCASAQLCGVPTPRVAGGWGCKVQPAGGGLQMQLLTGARPNSHHCDALSTHSQTGDVSANAPAPTQPSATNSPACAPLARTPTCLSTSTASTQARL